jgi:hypothetical protein
MNVNVVKNPNSVYAVEITELSCSVIVVCYGCKSTTAFSSIGIVDWFVELISL